AGVWLADQPHLSWRYVFAFGLAPVAVALLVRFCLRESERWERRRSAQRPRLADLFAPALRPATVAALLVSLSGLLTWWAINAFVPLLGAGLAAEHGAASGVVPAAQVVESWKSAASNAFNLGGLLGCLLAIPLAERLGRRRMFLAYFGAAALAIFAAFGLPLAAPQRIAMLFVVGVPVYGVFGTFVFYLPELFPTRLRALGAGFAYNIGRVLAAAGPFAVGAIAAPAGGDSAVIVQKLFWVGCAPLLAALLARRWVLETRGRSLPD
ncbi:MAG: MFS transporter, partial [Steroidobacteraceae bacterium]|nr:MFS transporter [Steroidobacteraceae bacterium]